MEPQKRQREIAGLTEDLEPPKTLKGAYGGFGASKTLKGNFYKKSGNTLGSLQLRFAVHSQKRR